MWNLASARLSTVSAGMLVNVETIAGYAYVYAARAQWPPLTELLGFALLITGVLIVVRLPAAPDMDNPGRARRHKPAPGVQSEYPPAGCVRTPQARGQSHRMHDQLQSKVLKQALQPAHLRPAQAKRPGTCCPRSKTEWRLPY